MPSLSPLRFQRLRAAGWRVLDPGGSGDVTGSVHDGTMTSYRRLSHSPRTSCVGESGGAYDAFDPDHTDAADPAAASNTDEKIEHDEDETGSGAAGVDASFDADDPGPADGSPLPRLLEKIDGLERAKRELLDVYRDVFAWGGTAQTTGYTRSEYVALVGRLPGSEEWKFDLLASRLPTAPVTAALLTDGQISIDQALSILSGTKRLRGDDLADVEAAAARAARDRNRRGDDPDCDTDVEQLVQRTRKAAEQDRRDRDRLERNRVTIQPDIFGGGRIIEDWADEEGFQTRLAAMEQAAGPPSPDVPRGTQLAEASLATARAWLAGRDTHPLTAAGDAGDGELLDLPGIETSWTRPASPDDVDLGPSSARSTMVVRIDVRDLRGVDPDDLATLRWLTTGSDAAFGRLLGAGRLSSTPWLGRQLLDTMACNADLIVSVVDGERPLAEFRRTNRLPDRIRRQVLWRDAGCRWPACKAPVAHVDVHHLDEDPTNHDVDNLLSLCRRHHRRLHSTFWHWQFDGATGRFDLLRSDHGDPVHTTYPNGTPPPPADPPEVAPAR